jgi:hypothetical protein
MSMVKLLPVVIVGQPDAALQAPPFEQAMVVPGTQTPPEHASLKVQVLLSSHASVLLVYWQPVAVEQVSVVQGLLSLQTIVVCVIAPVLELQESVVQALLSLMVIAVNTHPVAVLHESVVHLLLSKHCLVAFTQAPVDRLQ